jgi:photosystem II stability/assembly factor-like uncharacterized protein
MKTKLLLCFLSLSCIVNAQWLNIHTFRNPAYSFITCNNNLYAGLGGGGVYTSQDSGTTWVAVNNGIQFGGAYIFSLESRNDSIYAVLFGDVCFTYNNGANWSSLNLNLSMNSYVYALIPKGNFLFAGVGHDNSNGVYRKQLNGSGWTQVNNGLPVNVGVNAFVINTNSLFSGTDLGVYVSIDNGLNWTSSNNGIGAGISVKSLHIVNGNLLAGTNNGIYVSSNNGSTWNYSNGLPSNSVVTSFTSNNNDVVAGTYDGAFLSSDNGLNWTNFSNGIGSNSVYSLTSLGNYFYAGTGGNIFTTNPSLATSIPEKNTDIDDTWSVYPNPFSSQTTLQTDQLFKNATLTVYNSYGQTVKQINNISGQAVVFSRDNLPNGIYFLQLTVSSKVIATKKILITD